MTGKLEKHKDGNGWKLSYMDVRLKGTITHHEHEDGRTKVTLTQYDADGNILDVTVAIYDGDGILTTDQV